jgi:hypothetical protein
VAKRGDRAAPPPRSGEWDLLFGDASAADGWEALGKQAAGPLFEAWAHLRRDPRDRAVNADRIHPLKGSLGKKTIGGRELAQWQYEVTGAGRIWYCPDDARKVVHITWACAGHPPRTD